jgi:signal transduction histidine kinase
VLVGWSAAAAVSATAAVALLPVSPFGYRTPALLVALETANACIALLVGLLVYGRYRQGRRLQDLLTVVALCTAAGANLVLTALLSLSLGSDHGISPWASLAIRFLGSVTLAASALTPSSRELTGRRPHLVAAAMTLSVLSIGLLGTALGDHLGSTVRPTADGDTSELTGHPFALAVHGLGGVLYAVAAVAFTRKAVRTGDELMRWLGAGCVLGSVARLHYLLFPSMWPDAVHTGDLLRLGSFLLMLVGAVREIRAYWELRTHAAVLEDRRRMARDLHDGLTQELAYIWAQSRALAAHPGDPATVERIGGAAGRALDEARRAITALTRPVDEPFDQLLQRVLDDMAVRYDVKIVTALDAAVHVGPAQAEALLRITGEAVRNAVRHGAAQRIEITLDADPVCLSVRDDGHGFSPEREGGPRSGGFGITSMRERAQAIDAAFTLTSEPGVGTTVAVSRHE